jgi:hypothetical protein
MEKTFVQMVKLHFEYLIRKYSFDLLTSVESPRGHRWEGRVEYATKLTFIDIDCARGESPMIQIGRIKDIKKHLVSLDLVYEHLHLSREEKDLVLTHTLNKGLQKRVSEILYKKNLSPHIPISNNPAEKMDLELSISSKYLLQYAEPFLRGDFSRWLEIYEYKVEKMRAEFIRSGKDEYVLYHMGSDEKGKPIYGKRPVFQDSMNYLERLKEEYWK